MRIGQILRIRKSTEISHHTTAKYYCEFLSVMVLFVVQFSSGVCNNRRLCQINDGTNVRCIEFCMYCLKRHRFDFNKN